MCTVNTMFHMDKDYSWRWYIINASGKSSCISARSFFNFEDAKRNYDETHGRIIALGA
jgi:hypothetical protein